MNPVLIDIPLPFDVNGLQSITIRWYGLMYVVAIIVGILLTYREVKRKKMDLSLDDVLDFVLISVPLGIAFARLYYVAFEWSNYATDPVKIFFIWEGGLAIHGGIIGGILAVFLYIKWKKIEFWQFTDAVVPSLVLGQAFGRFGNFMNGDAYGTPPGENSPLGFLAMRFPSNTPAGREYPDSETAGMSQPLHPSMLYELVGNLAIFASLWILRTKGYRDGFITCLYFILYSVLRFFVEMTRGDSLWLVEGRFAAANVISVILFIVFAGLMAQWRLWRKKEDDAIKAA